MTYENFLDKIFKKSKPKIINPRVLYKSKEYQKQLAKLSVINFGWKEIVKVKETNELGIIKKSGSSTHQVIYLIQFQDGTKKQFNQDELEKTTPEEKEFYNNISNYNL